jgi:hypothetical protein
MGKRNKIIYWVATIWLCLGMISTGIIQLIPLEEEVEKMSALGYPLYFLTLIGIWKLLGVVAVLLPGYPLLKEWAYSGFFFLMSGAVFSHAAVGDQASEYFGPTLLLVLTVISWYMRPAERKVMITR